MLFQAAARNATILSAVLAAVKASSSDATTSSCILALELAFLHSILDLAVNDAHSAS